MGNNVLRLRKEDAVMVGIDFQERLMPAMKGNEELEAAAVKLIKGCRVLGVPVVMTQQYTKGLPGPNHTGDHCRPDRVHGRRCCCRRILYDRKNKLQRHGRIGIC